MKRLPFVPILSFVLFAIIWAVDLITPQLFVVAILLNGPIAMSGLALSTRFTTVMIAGAEIANIIAGYVNGAQAHYHWDTVGIGDRLLTAASFVLVGYLTIRAQALALEAGSATERGRVAEGEKRLRQSLEIVRATLNVDLVLRAIVSEALSLLEAQKTLLVRRASQLDVPDVYSAKRAGKIVVEVERIALDPGTASLIARARSEPQTISLTGEADPVARLVLEAHGGEHAAYLRLSRGGPDTILFVFSNEFDSDSKRLLAAFCEASGVALEQAEVFMQLGVRNEQIAAQRDALERSSRVIRDIVYALAHDLRTPLSATNVTMQQALDGAYGSLPEEYRKILRTSLGSNSDLQRLVETLLVVARFEAGETSTRKEPIHLKDQAERVATEMEPIAKLKSVALRVNGGGDAVVLGDDSELRRAMTNLVANAIDATPEGGSVELSILHRDRRVRVVVGDDGFGVPLEQRSKLFERFVPGDRRLGGGTGLGLYIVRLIAKKYGGSVAYAARDPHGSTFSIELPAQPE